MTKKPFNTTIIEQYFNNDHNIHKHLRSSI